MDKAALDEIIQNRRTIKPPMMSDAPVSDEDLNAILENANWAPSHGLTEPWRFKVYRGASRARLGKAFQELYETAVPEEKKKPGKAEKIGGMPEKAPVVILLWMQRQPNKKIAEVEEVEAVACAIQNMHLTATALGLGAFWSTPPFIYSKQMNEWLGIGEDDRCLGIFYLGHPAEPGQWPRGRRTSVDDKIEWIDD